MNLAQAAATYDLCTSGGDVLIQASVVYVTTPGATWTSVSVQTDDGTPFTVLSAADGAVANFGGGASIVPTSKTNWFYLKKGKKLQYTIVGTTGTGAADVVLSVVKVNQAGSLS